MGALAAPKPARLRKRTGTNVLILPGLLLLMFLLVLPYAHMLWVSFLTQSGSGGYVDRLTTANYASVLRSAYDWQILVRTIGFGVVTTCLCLIIAYPASYHLARSKSRYKGLLFAALISPLLVGVVIRTYGWMILLENHGVINSALLQLGWIKTPLPLMYDTFGVMVGLVHIYLPFMALSLVGSLQTVPPELEQVARSLGASPGRTFWRVTWPLSLPGVLSGTILVFVLTVSSYVIPDLLGGFSVLITPLLIVQTTMAAFDWPLGAAMGIIFFIVVALLVATYTRAMRKSLKRLEA